MTRTEDVDAAIERAKREVWQVAMGEVGATPQFARRVEAAFTLLAEEVVRLRAEHAECAAKPRKAIDAALREVGF